MTEPAPVNAGDLEAVGRFDLAVSKPRWRRGPHLGWPTTIAIAFIALIVFLSVFGGLIVPKNPDAQSLLLSEKLPGDGYLLGADQLGRDIFSRVIVASRQALLGPALVALGAALIGNVLGLIAGYFGGRADTLIMRWADLMYSLPPLLVAFVVAGIAGGGYAIAIVILVIVFSPYDARLVRGAVLGVRHLPYVEAARTLGISSPRIMALEIWPNVASVAVANAFLDFAYALVALASLSFLGIGVPPGATEWGRMLAEAKPMIFTNPGAALVPAFLLVATAASMNLIGDALYERLADRGKAHG